MHEDPFSRKSTVADLIHDGTWIWPPNWQRRFPSIFSSNCMHLVPNVSDRVCWKSNEGVLSEFSVGQVWKDIQEIDTVVPWAKVVWFNQNIPRHAFILWLAFQSKLQTHDIVSRWDGMGAFRCIFCKTVPDSHDHLFFECSFSSLVWNSLRHLTRLGPCPNQWSQIIPYVCTLGNSNSVWSVVNRLVLAACVYYIWQERNRRTHENTVRSPEDIAKLIKATVKLRLMGLPMSKSVHTMTVQRIWDLKGIQWKTKKPSPPPQPTNVHD